MESSTLVVESERLWHGESWPDMPLAFVDLDKADDQGGKIVLPPFPVIGIGGDRAHPMAAALDAVIEPPVQADQLAAQVAANPGAAAVFVQLLRLLPQLDARSGLVAESLAYAALQRGDEHRAWIAAQQRADAASVAAGDLLVDRDGGTLEITLDAPESGNAIDRAMRDALHDALSIAALDPAIVRVKLRANGKTFSLGAALHEFGTTVDPVTAHRIRCRTLPAWQAEQCADRLEVHVQGACVGSGLELAAWAVRLTASRRAWFHLPELAMGILPGAGGCVSLTRRIGRQRTALMVLSGKRLTAQQALEWGLVDEIVDSPA
jgi:1,4-dihydroxy-2-naphthoyl-CoA synthase